MERNICLNCKFWEVTDSRPIKNMKTGLCTRVKMFWESTEWTDEEVEDSWDCFRVLREENKKDRAFVQDGSDYKAELITLKDFGCNQFLIKDDYENIR